MNGNKARDKSKKTISSRGEHRGTQKERINRDAGIYRITKNLFLILFILSSLLIPFSKFPARFVQLRS